MQKVNIKTIFRDYKESYTKEEIADLESFLDDTKENGMFEFAVDDSYLMVAFNSDTEVVDTRVLQNYLYDNNEIAFEAYYDPQEVEIAN
jgi:hypothetical protein